jgi:hypothetical protein
VVQNAGQYRAGGLPVQVKRTTGTGEVTVYTRLIPKSVAYRDTIFVTIPNARNGVGVNKFEVTINPDNRQPEESFSNNTAVAELNVGGPGALPLLPADFAIVPITTASPTVSLLAQPVGTLSARFTIEVDTAATFNSGVRQTATLTGKNVLRYQPALLSADTVTYFWRVRYADIADANQNPWAGASFTVMRNGPTGWTQRRAAQLNQNAIDNQSVTTGLIGPASMWQSGRANANYTAGQLIDVFGVSDTGQETLVLSGASASAVLLPLGNISARQYPYLRLRLRGNQARQALRNWSVFYAGVAEGQTLAGATPASVEQGQSITVPFRFANLSGIRFTDSLLVRQTIYAPALGQPQIREYKIAAPAPGDTLSRTTTIETGAMPGLNNLLLTVNPRQQPEQTLVNNTIDIPFTVRPDRFGPVIDVAIDGARIQDGDAVAVSPLIDVFVTDENRFMPRRDTVGLDLYLQRPGQNQPFVRQPWRTPGLVASPEIEQNIFRIRYPLATLTEGSYRLRVTGRDVAGNPAAPYQIGFVVNKTAGIVRVVAAPNPFREQTRFLLDLTGEKAPADVTLTLANMTGQLIWTRTQPGRIGVNEFNWDGTTATGQPLPAGLYLYRITLGDGPDFPLTDGTALQGRVMLTR